MLVDINLTNSTVCRDETQPFISQDKRTKGLANRENVLKAFLDEKNAYGYIAVDDEKAGGTSAADDVVMYEYKK